MKAATRLLNVFLTICLLVGLLPVQALADIDPISGGTGILGQVLDEATGQPPESVTTTLRYDDESSDIITADEQCAVGSDGKFQFTYHGEGGAFPAGNYTLTFTSPFYLTKIVPIQITGNSGSEIVQTYLTPGGRIFGTVTDAQTGTALAGVTVNALSGGTVKGTASTDETGNYSLELEAGAYTIEFSKGNYQTSTLSRSFGPGTEPHIGASHVQLTPGSEGGNIEIIASGNCGANSGVTWTLDNEGTLTISGIGEIPDSLYHWESQFSHNSNIKQLIIENGITRIGNHAFYDCSNLTYVLFPDSLCEFGDWTFEFCSSLTDVVIPEGRAPKSLCKRE